MGIPKPHVSSSVPGLVQLLRAALRPERLMIDSRKPRRVEPVTQKLHEPNSRIDESMPDKNAVHCLERIDCKRVIVCSLESSWDQIYPRLPDHAPSGGVPQAQRKARPRRGPGFLSPGFPGFPSRRNSLASDFGIWQRCQISCLFHEDAQGAQVINLSILPR